MPCRDHCVFALLFSPLFYTSHESSVLSTYIEPKREKKKKNIGGKKKKKGKNPQSRHALAQQAGRAPLARLRNLTSSNCGAGAFRCGSRGPRGTETLPYLRPGRRGWGPSPERAAYARAAEREERGRLRRLVLAPAASADPGGRLSILRAGALPGAAASRGSRGAGGRAAPPALWPRSSPLLSI